MSDEPKIMEENSRIDRLVEKQKDHNKKSKYYAKIIGANLTSYICIMIPMLLIGFIWTDSGLPKIGWSLFSDALVTVVLFIIAENSAMQIGVEGGKLDDDYIRLHDEYLSLTDKIKKIGTSLMVPFCYWQIDVEYSTAVRTKCRSVGISVKEYEQKYKGKSLEELTKILPPIKAAKIHAINEMKPIELTPEVILTDGRRLEDRGGVPESADEYIDRKSKSTKHIVISVLTAAITVVPSFALTRDLSFGRVIYTLLKIIVLLMRMYKGYSQGAAAYNTVEVRHIEAKVMYEYAYLEYLDKKIYTKHGDKYGNIEQFTGEIEAEQITQNTIKS